MGALKDFAIITGKWSLFLIRFFLITLFKRYSNTVVFSCKYCVVFKNSFFYWTPPVPASNVVPGKFFWVLSSYNIWGKYLRKQNYKFFWRNPCKKDSQNIWNQPLSMELTLSRWGGLSTKFQPECVNVESSTERRS